MSSGAVPVACSVAGTTRDGNCVAAPECSCTVLDMTDYYQLAIDVVGLALGYSSASEAGDTEQADTYVKRITREMTEVESRTELLAAVVTVAVRVTKLAAASAEITPEALLARLSEIGLRGEAGE